MDEISKAAEQLAEQHGWSFDGAEWVHPDRPSYGYATADEVVDDWSLWEIPDLITKPSLPA